MQKNRIYSNCTIKIWNFIK